MLHSEGDKVVPYKDAVDTFQKAGQPKTLLTINSSSHAYSPEMREILEQGLRDW